MCIQCTSSHNVLSFTCGVIKFQGLLDLAVFRARGLWLPVCCNVCNLWSCLILLISSWVVFASSYSGKWHSNSSKKARGKTGSLSRNLTFWLHPYFLSLSAGRALSILLVCENRCGLGCICLAHACLVRDCFFLNLQGWTDTHTAVWEFSNFLLLGGECCNKA